MVFNHDKKTKKCPDPSFFVLRRMDKSGKGAKMKHYLVLCITVLLVGLTVFANADTIYLEPCDDMYTDVEHPTTPPTSDQLWVAEFSGANHFERIMIQFDLSNLENATIEDATLHLYRFFSCPMSGTTATNFYAITQEWSEETWNPHTHIQYNPYAWTSFTFSGTGGNYGIWFEVDITDLVQAWVNSQVENYGFVIRAQTGYKWSKFYSKEYSNPNLHPYLEVIYTASAIDEDVVMPPAVNIENYPNPFNKSTTISFSATSLSSATPRQAKIKIYNVKGNLVKNLELQISNSELKDITWDGTDNNGNKLATGIYFYRLVSNDFVSKTKKIVLIR